jgi:hypothetical protein
MTGPTILHGDGGAAALPSYEGIGTAGDKREHALYRGMGRPPKGDGHSSGVSWGAVIGGAFVAAALSLILLALGAGFGLSSISPWSNTGAARSPLGMTAIVWLIFMQIVVWSMGGYLAGRLRTKWVSIHSNEVYFRDTANGFLVWAVGVVITVTFLASAAATMVGGNGQETATKTAVDPNAYFVDSLFRSDPPKSDVADFAGRAEAERIFAREMLDSNASAADRSYLSGLVAARTGLSRADADTRVSQVITDARQAADAARRTTARLLFWLFIALLTGAFSASLAATIGGRQRDQVVLV